MRTAILLGAMIIANAIHPISKVDCIIILLNSASWDLVVFVNKKEK